MKACRHEVVMAWWRPSGELFIDIKNRLVYILHPCLVCVIKYIYVYGLFYTNSHQFYVYKVIM